MRRRVLILLPVLLIFGMAAFYTGCGHDTGEQEGSEEDFRVPDSLLSPLEAYGLTTDEYHPINGGVMANNNIHLYYPASDVARFLAVKMFGFAIESHRMVTSEIGRPANGKVFIIGCKDLKEYEFLTRKEWWYYGVIQGDTIYFEPFDIMLKRYDKNSQRSIAQIGFMQRMAQMALIRISKGRVPNWIRESVASYIANEGKILEIQANQYSKQYIGFDPTYDELEGYLAAAVEIDVTRVSFYYAYRMLENLLSMSSMKNLLTFVRKLGEGRTLDEASREVFEMEYIELIEKIKVRGEAGESI